jgi:hypothetical protein
MSAENKPASVTMYGMGGATIAYQSGQFLASTPAARAAELALMVSAFVGELEELHGVAFRVELAASLGVA